MKKISLYIFKYWYAYLFAVVAMVVSVTLDMITPFFTKHIIDDVIIGGKLNLLSKFLLFILLVGIGRAILQYFKEIIFDFVSSRIATDFRRHLFQHIEKLSINFFNKNNTGELLSRVKEDIDTIWNAIGFVGMLIIEVFIHSAIALYCMFRLNIKLTVIPLLAMLLVGVLAIIMEKRLGKIFEAIHEENGKLNTVAQENLAGVRTVKAYAREKFEITKFLSRNKRYYDLNMQQSKVFIKYYPYFQFISKMVTLSVLILGGYEVINDRITLGDLGAFVEYSMNIVWPLEMLGWLTNDLSSALASKKRIDKIYSQTSEIIEKQSPVVLDHIRGSLTFEQVSFKIEGKAILEDINFHLPAGKSLGIMGVTGSGKSSIIHLLQRFYNHTEGEIKLDDINIQHLSIKQLRENISVVMQDVFLFSTSIKNNIRFGKATLIGEEEILNSAKMAQAEEFIESMRDEYETVIGERGVGLSGGQKQRISIARTLSKKAPIIVLDDSTSALDMETEYAIQKGLSNVDATKIIIAHRISAVKNADEIIVLEDGKIVERGTHKTLLEQKGYYYKTYLSQYGDIDREVILCQ